MTIYHVSSTSANYREQFFTATEAKKAMRKLMKEGHTDVCGSKTKVYSNGEWEPCGEINLTGSNASMLQNSPRNMTQANY